VTVACRVIFGSTSRVLPRRCAYSLLLSRLPVICYTRWTPQGGCCSCERLLSSRTPRKPSFRAGRSMIRLHDFFCWLTLFAQLLRLFMYLGALAGSYGLHVIGESFWNVSFFRYPFHMCFTVKLWGRKLSLKCLPTHCWSPLRWTRKYFAKNVRNWRRYTYPHWPMSCNSSTFFVLLEGGRRGSSENALKVFVFNEGKSFHMWRKKFFLWIYPGSFRPT
jgi:hypothetical protein